jgi:hypothetical protein
MNSIFEVSRLCVAIVLALVIAGCSSHPTRVDCDGTLRPINAPAPVAHASGRSP